MKGIVVKSTGSWYSVRMDSGEVMECRIKGKFRMKGIKTTNPVAVGDVVEVEVNPDGAVINRIEDRKNYIIPLAYKSGSKLPTTSNHPRYMHLFY